MDIENIDLPSYADLVGAALPRRRGGPSGSHLPEEMQKNVVRHLLANNNISATARTLGLSRDQVRTIKYAMFKITLNQYREFKRMARR